MCPPRNKAVFWPADGGHLMTEAAKRLKRLFGLIQRLLEPETNMLG